MTPTDDLRITLRTNLNEIIPPGGSDTDTLFTNAEIDSLLTRSLTVEEASWRGWVLKCMRIAEASLGMLSQAQMGSEQFRWATPTDVAPVCKDIVQYWYDSIPIGMAPVFGSGPRILSIAPVPMPGINVPVTGGYAALMDDPWVGSSQTPWWPGDMTRLLTYVKAGWQWPSAETVVATIPEP